MTATELMKHQVNQAGRQIDACLNGMKEEGYDAKLTPDGMTVREMLEHLSEAYLAYMAHCRGEKYQWGSYKIEDKSPANLTKTYRDLRAQAVEAALANEDGDTLKNAYDYIVGHDNYHVGQLVLIRLQVDPDWDSDSIYA